MPGPFGGGGIGDEVTGPWLITGSFTVDGESTFLDTINARFGNMSVIVGADGGANTLTDATPKHGRTGSPHFTNAEEPMAMIYANSSAGNNNLYLGGGTSQMNAATVIRFNTAADITTVNGTTVLTLNIEQATFAVGITAANLPTSDPSSAGVWWVNSGVVTVSAG